MKELFGLMNGKLSHPDKSLKDHSEGVLKKIKEIVEFHNIEIPYETMAITHDIAKAHPLFQKSLFGGKKFPHSELSSLITLTLSKDVLQAEVVRRHHSHLVGYNDITKFLNNIDIFENSQKLKDFTDFEILTEKELRKLCVKFERTYCPDEDNPAYDLWFKLRTMYSLLITADRLDAIGASRAGLRKFEYNAKKFEDYLKNLPQNKLSSWRNDLRLKVIEKIESLDGGSIFTLTLPTGAGKTLIGLQGASIITNKFNKKTLIYVLPFISIVEQVVSVAKNIFDDVQEDHYLVSYQSNNGKEYDLSPIQKFVSTFRYWYSPIVVTTMAKLWEVFYSPYSNDTMNFHRLKDAVVILDEPQSLRADLWLGFGKTIEYLSQKFGTVFILMTATQPKISKGLEIAPKTSFPKSRHRYHYLKDIERTEDLFRLIEKDKNNLIIMNTRKMALKTYYELKEHLKEPVYFLSTWVIPKQRREVIEKIKRLEKSDLPRNLISTQVVEAGVDIDFERVIRDIAPFDSIVQAGGRCNRNMKNETGEIYIVNLKNEHNHLIANYVYDQVSLECTKEIFEIETELDESKIPAVLERYYTELFKRRKQNLLWKSIGEGEWGDYESLYELRGFQEATVFVDIDGRVGELFEKLNELESNLENLDLKRSIWRELEQYAINVPIKELENWKRGKSQIFIDNTEPLIEELSIGIWKINRKGIGKIYDIECGFIPYEFENEGDFEW
ncbi:MAG: CRISPR-associated endonuclease/helicase Cas3 [Thermotogaceae bacterium]|jgi:CRISPR-associated endonuclease/helicase Cas3|nr:CRISPR-associated endonuclease/helicase Cas3 [Thermotogaceae bacterium]